MRISYDKLWTLMKKNRLIKRDISRVADISDYTLCKMGRNEPVAMDNMVRLCGLFHCDIGDLMEVIEDED